MFKVEIDWDKAHAETREVIVHGENVLELNKDKDCLRTHTILGVLGTEKATRPVRVTVAPNATPPMPSAPAAPTQQFVKMNKYQFDQLLATIKEHATNTNVRDNAKLTHMQIHEKLLGLVEHD